MNSLPFQFPTPKAIRHLIRWICIVSICSLAIDTLFHTHLVHLFSLTENSYRHLFLWQPFTALFLIPAYSLSFGFLLDIAFAMLLLWLLGSLLVERIGAKTFFIAYASCGIVSGLLGLLAAFFFSSMPWQQLGLCLPAILGICTIWTMSDPYQKIILFFIIPIQARWILAAACIGTLFNALAAADVALFFTYATAFIWSWLFGVLFLKFSGPFEWMRKPAASLQAFWDWRVCSLFRKSRKK
jgi:hypothetical protein